MAQARVGDTQVGQNNGLEFAVARLLRGDRRLLPERGAFCEIPLLRTAKRDVVVGP